MKNETPLPTARRGRRTCRRVLLLGSSRVARVGMRRWYGGWQCVSPVGPVVHHAPCQPQRTAPVVAVVMRRARGRATVYDRTIALYVHETPFYDLFTVQAHDKCAVVQFLILRRKRVQRIETHFGEIKAQLYTIG